MHKRIALNLLLLLIPISVMAQQTSAPPAPSGTKPVEGDYVIHDFHFRSGEQLAELRLHYRTIRTAQRDLPAWCAMQC